MGAKQSLDVQVFCTVRYNSINETSILSITENAIISTYPFIKTVNIDKILDIEYEIITKLLKIRYIDNKDGNKGEDKSVKNEIEDVYKMSVFHIFMIENIDKLQKFIKESQIKRIKKRKIDNINYKLYSYIDSNNNEVIVSKQKNIIKINTVDNSIIEINDEDLYKVNIIDDLICFHKQNGVLLFSDMFKLYEKIDVNMIKTLNKNVHEYSYDTVNTLGMLHFI